MLARERDEEQARAVEAAAQEALRNLQQLGDTDRMSSQAAPSDVGPEEDPFGCIPERTGPDCVGLPRTQVYMSASDLHMCST